MKRASISEAKNGLSALLDRVRQGQTVIIEDRGVPVARLAPIVTAGDAEGRLARLVRQGIARPPRRRADAALLRTKPPHLGKGQSGTAIILEERGEGR